MDKQQQQDLQQIREFYDDVYYRGLNAGARPLRHLQRLAARLGVAAGQQVLDVACGDGQWLQVCSELGAAPCGIDLSQRAIDACIQRMPQGEFHAQPAETLPYADDRFDLVTCLGSLEHFVDPLAALREMVRVGKPEARFVILVPNKDFLTRRLGLFAGTRQVDAKEVVRTLEEWRTLFEQAGLKVEARWKDLHVLSWRWISLGRWYLVPLRFAQAIMLAVWPLRWQYQVYHLAGRG